MYALVWMTTDERDEIVFGKDKGELLGRYHELLHDATTHTVTLCEYVTKRSECETYIHIHNVKGKSPDWSCGEWSEPTGKSPIGFGETLWVPIKSTDYDTPKVERTIFSRVPVPSISIDGYKPISPNTPLGAQLVELERAALTLIAMAPAAEEQIEAVALLQAKAIIEAHHT